MIFQLFFFFSCTLIIEDKETGLKSRVLVFNIFMESNRGNLGFYKWKSVQCYISISLKFIPHSFKVNFLSKLNFDYN